MRLFRENGKLTHRINATERVLRHITIITITNFIAGTDGRENVSTKT